MRRSHATYIECSVEFDRKGNPRLSDFTPVRGLRPKSYEEIDGCDRDALLDQTGTTRARLGVGCALFVDPTRLTLGSDRVLAALCDTSIFEEPVMPSPALLGIRRDLLASGTWGCLDTCSGLAEWSQYENDLPVEAVRESGEIGFYFSDTVGIITPDTASSRREDAIQRAARIEAQTDWKRLGHTGPVVNIQAMLDDTTPWYAYSPDIGAIEVIYKMTIDLPHVAGGWRMRDLEHRCEGKTYRPLDRPVYVVTPHNSITIPDSYCSEGDVDEDIEELDDAAIRRRLIKADCSKTDTGAVRIAAIPFDTDGISIKSPILDLGDWNTLLLNSNAKFRSSMEAVGWLSLDINDPLPD